MVDQQGALEKKNSDDEPHASRTPEIRNPNEFKEKYRRYTAHIKIIALLVFALGSIAAASIRIFWPHGEGIHDLVLWAGQLLEHLAFSLAVSGIAVFGYEKLTHARESFETLESMKRSTQEQEATRRTLQKSLELTDSLKELQESIHELRISEGKQALIRGLENRLGDDARARKLREHLLEVVEASREVGRTEVEFLTFLTWYIDLGLRENLSDLAKIMSDERGRGTFSLKVTAVEVVGRVFGTLMKLLGKGSSYDSISRLHIWRSDKFSYYYDKTKIAVSNGVTIRRVFNVYGLTVRGSTEKERDDDIKQVVDALRMHLELTNKYPFKDYDESKLQGYYETRIFGQEELDSISSDELTRANYIRSLMGFFRIKEKNGGTRRIQFAAKQHSPPLTELSYGYFDESSSDVKMFEEMWKASKDSALTEGRIKVIEEQLKSHSRISKIT